MAGFNPQAPPHLSQHQLMDRYPSPTQMAVAGSYAYGPPQAQPSPHLPPLNLPPIRVDSQPQPPQQPGHAPMGSPLPPPQHGMPQYYAHPPPNMQPQQMPMGSMRYQLPPQQGDHQRVLSGGRHKKEIKRRTKTGCLTCRKRRIKCDEHHPACRNCAKSKRDCLGYDPIFKPQPGPSQIQPAPSSTSQHQTSSPAPQPSTTAPYATQVPQGYAPAATAGYPPPPPAAAPAHHQHDSFNNSAIDPALAAADPAMHGQPQYNGVHALNPALRGSPYAAPGSDQPMRGKPLDISQIFAIAQHSPPDVPPRHDPIPRELDDEFAGIYTKDYIVGLDVMLESTWFSTNNNGLNRLFANRALHEEAAFFTETVKYRTSAQDMSGIFSQEARLIWHLLGSCKHPDPAMNGANGIKPDHDDLALMEVRARFDVLECLLTNQNLEVNPLRHIGYPPDIPDMKRAEMEFWEQLGEFVVNDNQSAPPGAADYALGRMRAVLNAHEVRDAIYSIAIARHAGNRVRGFPNALPASVDQNPESDLTKLNVAMSFISHECRAGTQQVIARVCDMAMLSWTVSRS